MRSDSLGEEVKSVPAKRSRKARVSPNIQPAGTPRFRYRVRFAKTGLLRWISHRDLASLWERIGRRVDLPFSMTEGFHPKPRIGFPSALPLGVESLDEVVEIDLRQQWSCDQMLEVLRSDNQPGLAINSVTAVDMADGKAQMVSADYKISLPDDWKDDERHKIVDAMKHVLSQETVSITRKDKPVTLVVRDQIFHLQFSADSLRMRLANTKGTSLKASDVLGLLDADDWPLRGATIVRTHVWLKGQQPSDFTEQSTCRRSSNASSEDVRSHLADSNALLGN